MNYKQKIIDCIKCYNIHSDQLIDACMFLNEDRAVQYLVWISFKEIKHNFIGEEFMTLSFEFIYRVLTDTINSRDERIQKQITSKLDPSYDLIYTNYNDSYNHDLESIQDCIDAKSTYPIDKDGIAYEGLHDSADYILYNLPLTQEEKEWLEDSDNDNAIKQAIYDRDSSSPVSDMLGRTDFNVRVQMFSNYDVLNSNYYIESSGGYEYDGIFKQIVDALNLNPKTLSVAMYHKSIKNIGEWPHMGDRIGEEYVLYQDFVGELSESIGSSNHLVFLGRMNGGDILEKDEGEYYTVTIPAGNTCGLFDPNTGSGSILDCTLLRDFTVQVSKSLDTKHDSFELYVDQIHGYSIDQTYGLTAESWGDNISIT